MTKNNGTSGAVGRAPNGTDGLLLIARLVSGVPVDPNAIASLDDTRIRDIALRVRSANGGGPGAAFESAIADSFPNIDERNDFRASVFSLDPSCETSQPLQENLVPSAYPPLPEWACVDTEPALGWVDEYMGYADAISPMTPRIFHESAGLWLYAVGIARRIKLTMPYDTVYPNLFVAWDAQTTLHRKTTGLNTARTMARTVFPHLLAPQESTPEALLADMAGKEPSGWEGMTAHDQAEWQEGRNHAAQRGLFSDEMSGLMAGAGRDYNIGQLEALMRFYDCDPTFTRLTRGQGRVTVRNAYLCFLGASTPGALATHLNSERLWGMGWWPRFAMLTPEDDRPEWREPIGADTPHALIEKLAAMTKRLPVAQWPDPPTAITATLGTGAFDAWRNYNRALSYDLITPDLDQRLAGTYGRLPTLMLKVAIILAAMDWPKHAPAPKIELTHIARAIKIAESWRASVHRVVAQARENDFSQLTKRIMRQLGLHQRDGMSSRDLCRSMADKRSNEIRDALDELLNLGMVVESDDRPGKIGRPSKRFFLSTE